jgi:hypothetical protein
LELGIEGDQQQIPDLLLAGPRPRLANSSTSSTQGILADRSLGDPTVSEDAKIGLGRI